MVAARRASSLVGAPGGPGDTPPRVDGAVPVYRGPTREQPHAAVLVAHRPLRERTMQQHQGATSALIDGRLGRLGAWAADHRRAIAIAWCAMVLALGALAPFADRALSGAGWEAT